VRLDVEVVLCFCGRGREAGLCGEHKWEDGEVCYGGGCAFALFGGRRGHYVCVCVWAVGREYVLVVVVGCAECSADLVEKFWQGSGVDHL
jgi:hypothetical protein